MKWASWGLFDFRAGGKVQPIVMAAAFDPDGWKRVSNEMIAEAGVDVRLNSWFSRAVMDGNRITGVICETKEGRQAIMGGVVVDATGDLDVACAAGSPFTHGSYMLTTVFRLGGVDTEVAERFRWEEPQRFAELDRQAKKIIGGSWDRWWLKTPLPGVVWCNCPHMAGLDGLKVADLTRAEVQGRATIHKVIEFIRAKLPGFENCYLVDLAPQTGIRQTRLLEGEYVMTKEDVAQRARFADSVARGRDYYYPFRSLVPRSVENLLVAGRHYSSTSAAQKISREIPPCMAMGEATGTAAALALDAGVAVRHVDIAKLQRTLRAQGADPGDQKGPNADTPAMARSFAEAA
jgi:hypothetical protein